MSQTIVMSSDAAQASITELLGVRGTDYPQRQVDFSESTVTSMTTGRSVSNELFPTMEHFIAAVLVQANKVPQVAHIFEQHDKEIGDRWQ